MISNERVEEIEEWLSWAKSSIYRQMIEDLLTEVKDLQEFLREFVEDHEMAMTVLNESHRLLDSHNEMLRIENASLKQFISTWGEKDG